MKLLGIISVDFSVTDQLLIRYSAFICYWRKSGSIMEQYISYLKILRKPVTLRREVLYNILKGCGIPVELVRLIKMFVNETSSKICVGRTLSEAFPVQNCLKQGDNLLPFLFNFALEYAIRKDWN
jgi:hypothetical protein